MAVYVKPKWRKYIPHFEIYLNFPLIRTQMIVFNEDTNMFRFVYLGFQWQIWKWEGRVLLFEIGREYIGMLGSEAKESSILKICNDGCAYVVPNRSRVFCEKHWALEHESSLKKALRAVKEKLK